jgi:hypothetical protein
MSGHPVLASLGAHRATLWVLGLLLFGAGDTVTTVVGLQSAHVVELGPLVGPVVAQFGLAGILSLKAAALGVCYTLYRLVPEPHDLGVPIGIVFLGGVVSTWNLSVLGRLLLACH